MSPLCCCRWGFLDRSRILVEILSARFGFCHADDRLYLDGFLLCDILLLANGHTSGWIARVLRIGWLREIGTVSYCIYIVHIVVCRFACAIASQSAADLSGKGAAVTVLAPF